MLALLRHCLTQWEVRVEGDGGLNRLQLKYLDLVEFAEAYDHVNTLLGCLSDLSFSTLMSGMTTVAWWSDSSLRSIPAIKG